MKKPVLGAAVFATALIVATAAPAQAPQVRVRGSIESVSGQLLTVKTRDGADVKIKLADNAPVRTVTKASLSDIKPGSYVGITAMPQPDGTQKAVEIHIFPEAMRGAGEGHRPWDLMPNSTMTNATVDTQVVESDGQKLVLKYKDGDKTFIVPSNATVVAFANAAMSDLKPGAIIFVGGAAKEPDGTLDAPNITVGTNGVNPPM
jgi:hypothetical protein